MHHITCCIPFCRFVQDQNQDDQAEDGEQQEASTSGRNAQPQGFGLNPVLLALAAAYVLPGPLAPLVALTLPFFLGGRKQSRQSRQRRRSASSSQNKAGADVSREEEDGSDWMSGGQQTGQGGFGFSDGPAQDLRGEGRSVEAEMKKEEQEEAWQRRRQQQMAAFQQQQILFNLMRVMGGGMMGRGGFRRPYGMRGGFGGPFLF